MENKNKLLGIKSVDLEDEFLFLAFAGFCVTTMERNATDRHAFVRMVRQVRFGELC